MLGQRAGAFVVAGMILSAVLKAVVTGVLFTFCRAWQTSQISCTQNIINFAMRPAFNIKLRTLRRHGLSNRIMTGMAQWRLLIERSAGPLSSGWARWRA